MDCEQVQSELLAADDLEAPDGVLARVDQHVAGCATCAELVRKLRRLNETVRSLPVPVDIQAAQARFESQFAEKLTAAPTHKRRWIIAPPRWVAAAAIVLLATGVAFWTYSYSEHRAAASTLALQQ